MPGGKSTNCCVKMCPSNVPGHRMLVHGIPEDCSIKRKWLNAVGHSVGVCERHFTGMYQARNRKNIYKLLF